MAEAVVSSAVKRLGDLLVSEAENLSEVEHQIYEIQHELKRTQCFLQEADKKQYGNERLRRWVTEIRNLSFKVEDVIEIFAFEVANEPAGFYGMVQKFALTLSKLVTSHNVVTEINGIKAELSSLTACLKTDGIARGLESLVVNWKSERILCSGDVEEDYVGMEKVMENMICDLKRKDKGCEVVSIYGRGGQGKTTLAKKLYDHREFRDYCKVWICITQQFDREKVLQTVLQQVLPRGMERNVTWMDDAKLVRELHKVQTEKNCLIVIDDIPTIDYWRSLEDGFPVGKATSASKIVLTSRDVKLAETGSFCKIPSLTEEEGWQLLSRKARISHLQDKRVASGMENVGRKMVNICKGLPLAISVLGGILEGKSLSEWETVYKDISFDFAKGEGQTHDDDYYAVTQVLALSYDNIPLCLRHCFLCFANYKEDEEIDTEELYMIWMAEGLISVEDKIPGEMMMDVAERYLAELAHRSLVQVEVSKTDGASWSEYRKCRVHDLVRDFCLSKVREEEFLNVVHLRGKYDNESTTSIVRRLCIRSYEHGDESVLKSYDQHVISHIRSLFIWKVPFSTIIRWPNEILSLQKFKLLRVFTASRYKFSNHDIRSITELVYLKYLCLLDCRLEEELPSSIGNLRNLETLDLRVSDPIRIPNVLWKLKQLKQLYLPTSHEHLVEKLRLDGLNELELLHNYDSRYCEALDVICLPKLKAFRGDILLEDNHKEQNLINFINSRGLRYCYLNISGGRTRCSEGVASCLVLLLECSFIDALTINAKICRFPEDYDHTCISSRRFTKISLMYCKMEDDPMVLLEKLPNLRILHLCDAYIGAEMACTAMGFPRLKELYLSSLRGLREWRLDEGALQNLSSIWLYECPELEMLPEGMKYLSALESLYMAGMPCTFKDKVKRKDGTEGEDFYKVRHVHRVTI